MASRPMSSSIVKEGVQPCLRNTGQSCNAPTRMLVPRSRVTNAAKRAWPSRGSQQRLFCKANHILDVRNDITVAQEEVFGPVL